MSKPEKQTFTATERKPWTGGAASIEKGGGLYNAVFMKIVDGVVVEITRGPGDTLHSVQTSVDLFVRKNAQK